MAAEFPNPEPGWQAEQPARPVDRAEIERRLGPVCGEIVPLDGGLANDSFRIGPDRVLRIYRRDVSALHRERLLLSRERRNFRVPRVLGGGDDFLLLEFLAHAPLKNTREQGEAAGRAAAEIHRTRMNCCGFLGDALEVKTPLDDFPRAMIEYAREQGAARPEHAPQLDRVAQCLAEHSARLQAECARPVLLHGDFKASNLRWGNDGRLVVFDWEFAYAGPALLDLGQLSRWGVPRPFRDGLERGYVAEGGELSAEWDATAALFDLVNLSGLLAKSAPGSRQESDCRLRIEQTLAARGKA